MFIETISNLFIEKKCFGCEQPWHFFCPKCSGDIDTYKPYCYVCKKRSSNFFVHNECQKYLGLNQVIVLTRYRKAWVKKLLRHAKFYGKYLAYSDMIEYHRSFFETYIDTRGSLLVPVPMHFMRKWKRWYNQSEKIARGLSKVLNIPVENRCIKRIRYTSQQSHLWASERQNNLRWAFWLWGSSVRKNRTIGSTLWEIANFLKDNWYSDIRAIVLASD